MLSRVFYGPLCILALFATVLLAGVAVPAATAPNSAIGVIDLDGITKEFTGYQLATQRIRAFAKIRNDAFETLQAGRGLSEEEFKTYRDLTSGGVTIDPTKVDQLKATAKTNRATLDALKAKDKEKEKQPLTEDEKKQLDALLKNDNIITAMLTEQGNKINQEIEEQYTTYVKILTEVVDKGISKVAESKKLGIVVSKDVRIGENAEKFVLWGGTDITPDVVKLLNDTFKESQLDTTPSKTKPKDTGAHANEGG